MNFNPIAAMADGMSFGEATSRLATNDNAREPFITTFTGRFYPFSPLASEVNIYDIARALSMQCRYSGHGARFYSVAEHSVLVAREVLDCTGSKADALAGLLHDAPEALSGFGDIASPVKSRVPFIAQVEARIYVSVATFAGIAPIIPPIVHEIDARITADEMADNMHECPVPHEPLGVTLEYWTPDVAEAEFLRMWNQLGCRV